jgi:DNA-binding CsgD family transcriptional regulator
VGEVAQRLVNGSSVIVVGALGSGKSFFSRAVADELRARQLQPVAVRGARPLSTQPFAALRAAGDPALLELMRGARPAGSAPVILMVDDAHALDVESTGLITQGIYAGTVRALLSITVDRTSRQTVPGDAAGVGQALTDLWLQGGALRYDLHDLDAEEADAFISGFAGAELLDSVTRTALAVHSSGSRMILRELVAEATAAAGRGESEPLGAALSFTPHSPLADVLDAELAHFPAEEVTALGLLARLPGVAYANACKVISPETLDSLIRRRTLHEDASPGRALHVDSVMGRAAQWHLVPAELNRAIDEAVTRTLASAATVAPGMVLSTLVASRWHAGVGTVPLPGAVDPSTRRRIYTQAASTANLREHPDLALAYARLGLAIGQSDELTIEVARAQAGMHHFELAYETLEELDLRPMASADLRRYVRTFGALIMWVPAKRGLDDLTTRLRDAGRFDASVWCELDVLRAENACLAMDWISTVHIAREVLASESARHLARIRCALVGALASTHLGHGREARELFDEATRLTHDPVTGRADNVVTELWILCLEALTRSLSGVGVAELRPRLARVTAVAIAHDNRGALALAGVASAFLAGFAGDARAAALDFGAAVERLNRLGYASWRPMVAHAYATVLADLGETERARAVMAQVDEHGMPQHRMFAYSRLSADARVHAAEGDEAGAELLARAALDLSGPEAPVLQHWGLVQLSRYGEADEVLARRIRNASEALEYPMPHAITQHILGEATGDSELLARAAAEFAGMGAGWAKATPAAPDHRQVWARAVAVGEGITAELTEREYEIALLVATGLSNKQIAERLYLSVRTVESHVYQARGKLGARSRRELGRMVGTPG